MARSRSRPRRALHTSSHDDFFGMPSVPDTTPTIGRLRRVLVIIDFSEVRHVAEELCHSDSLQVTRCNLLPVLTGTEETALCTFSLLLPVSKLLRVTLGELISNVSDRKSIT